MPSLRVSKTPRTWPNTKIVTVQIDTIEAIASDYDVIVFDQWGVLHNGTSAYEGAIAAIGALTCTTAVLSNSGKRSAPNAARISNMGFAEDAFDYVMTSGEALYQDVATGQIDAVKLYPIERAKGDAAAWADGLDIALVGDAPSADGLLMMGLPDGANLETWMPSLEEWHGRDLPMYCSNPDRQSPRAGKLVASPGALAHAYQSMGGKTVFYGKPHRPVFDALENLFGKGRYLMVGDSMEHDIAGAQGAGWDSLLVESGLYADRFAAQDGNEVTADIAAKMKCDLPTYRIKGVR